VPPLRERREDILPLARQLFTASAKRFGRKSPALTPAAANRLLRYAWPGNVRELENALERAVALARSDRIDVDDLPAELDAAPPIVHTADDVRTLADVEREDIAAALRASGGNPRQGRRTAGHWRRDVIPETQTRTTIIATHGRRLGSIVDATRRATPLR
jgi:DNA-binding NtrC family response regulator